MSSRRASGYAQEPNQWYVEPVWATTLFLESAP